MHLLHMVLVVPHECNYCFSRHMSGCPADKDLFCTCYSTVVGNKSAMEAALWRLGEEGSDHAPLTMLCQLKHESNVRWYGKLPWGSNCPLALGE